MGKSLTRQLFESLTNKYCEDFGYEIWADGSCVSADSGFDSEEDARAGAENDLALNADTDDNNPYTLDDVDIHIFEESLNKVISRLNEASVDPQTIEDNKILQQVRAKLQGRRPAENAFTPEEKAILKKYDLDAWGFKGDDKMVTKGINIAEPTEKKYRYTRSRRKQDQYTTNADKINLADRAGKKPARMKDNDIKDTYHDYTAGTYSGNSFHDKNRAYDANLISDKTRKMKHALSKRKAAQRNLDNFDDDVAQSISDSQAIFNDKMKDAEEKRDRNLDWYKERSQASQDRIDSILARHKREALEALSDQIHKLNEAEMSDEDKADSALLRSIFDKTQARANAALTPEEKEVLKKYNLTRNSQYKDLYSPGGWSITRTTDNYGRHNLDKVNLAGRARTRDARMAHRDIKDRFSQTYQDKNREYDAELISRDYRNMKDAIDDRKYYKDKIDSANSEYDDTLKKELDNLEKRRARAVDRDREKAGWQKDIDDANNEIKGLLKKEALNEEDNGNEALSLVARLAKQVFPITPNGNIKKSRVEDFNKFLSSLEIEEETVDDSTATVYTIYPSWGMTLFEAQKFNELIKQAPEIDQLVDFGAIKFTLKSDNNTIQESLLEADEEEAIRKIPSGLSGKINNEILNSIIGQMSDGYWENDPQYNQYWLYVDIDDDNNFVIPNKMYSSSSWGSSTRNGFYGKDDAWVRNFFANKIKTIAQVYLNDHNLNPYDNWNENCDEVCTYLNYREPVTIGDAYKAYKALK